MKKIKILLLLILCFLLTGCFDYQELNNRAIVSGMSIDYKDEKFTVTLEILNSKKSDSKKESSNKTYYVEGSGSTLSEAFQDCNLKISKEAYYSHLKVLIISEVIAKDQMENILDYMLRDPSIRNIFIPVMADGTDASEVLKTTTESNPVSSEAIQSLLENNKANHNITVSMDFENFIDAIVDPHKDAYINTIKKEEDALVLNGIATFHEFQLATVLNQSEAATFNVLNNKSDNYFLKTSCDDLEEKYITVDFYQNKDTKIEVKDKKLLIQSDLKASIVEDECSLNFRDPEVYKKVEQLFQKSVNEKYQKVLQKLQKNKTDVLHINETYYKKERKDLTNWYELELSFETSIDINKNGLIFKVKTDE